MSQENNGFSGSRMEKTLESIHVNSPNGERAREVVRLMAFRWAKYKTMSRSFKMCRGIEEEQRRNPQETCLRGLRICPRVNSEEEIVNEIWTTTEVRGARIKGVQQA